MPTRSGRTGVAFTWEGKLNLRNAKYKKDDTPISIIDIGPGEGHLSFYLISSLLKNYPSIENKFNLILLQIKLLSLIIL